MSLVQNRFSEAKDHKAHIACLGKFSYTDQAAHGLQQHFFDQYGQDVIIDNYDSVELA